MQEALGLILSTEKKTQKPPPPPPTKTNQALVAYACNPSY
jgi:hypothetical protein